MNHAPSAAGRAAGGSEPSRFERWAALMPLAIVVFFALQFVVRLLLPPVLEVDDAEMVNQLHWAWGSGERSVQNHY